jgi:flap endonuclease-1
MGIAFREIIPSQSIDFHSLNNKILVFDAYNTLYQFITTIRSQDGAPLMDSKGKITSHLSGLLSRTASLIQKGIMPVYVFDGTPPDLKRATLGQRRMIKEEAEKKFLEAKEKKDVGGMKKYASRTSRLTQDMANEAMQLVSHMGIPFVHAPSEGEAQASYMVKKGDGYAVASQDFDSLMHGATKLIRNLSITGKRKRINSPTYSTVAPEILDLADILNTLGIDQNQLITLAMLVGTDYNPAGIKGIGPKTALKLVKQYGTDFKSLFKYVKWDECFNYSWEEVYYLIKKIPVTDDYSLKRNQVDESKILGMLVDDHDFSEERVKSSIGKMVKAQTNSGQKSLADY